MLKKLRESPSPQISGKPISPAQASVSPRPAIPPTTGFPAGLPPGFTHGAAQAIPGLPPGFPSSPYLGFPGAAPPTSSSGAPCTDPMCRDPACPTYQLRAAQAQLLAMSGMGLGLPGAPLPMGYPYSLPPNIPGLPGAVPGFP